jgi:signal transduction histidine kinase
VTGAMVYGSGRLDYKLELQSSEKEFKQLADTMNYMAQRIAQTEKEIDERNKEFISIATHELRAPMTSIIGYLSILGENIGDKLNKQNSLLFTSAYDGSIRLRDLVNDMLDAARLEGGREEFRLNKLQISKYITECINSMDVVAKQNEISIYYDDKDTADVIADEGKTRIILNNFVSNAIKYNHIHGKVKISHIKHKDQLVTAIASTGPTIPADQQAHMFEKFFRVDTPEHKKVTGTGIGMYVTKQYIEAMNGKTWFTSNPGEDTVFYFSLPLAGETTSENSIAAITPKPTNSKWIMRWRRRIK